MAILRTIEAGWVLATESPEANAEAGELVITERLRDGMRRAVESDKFGWKGRLFVLPGTETRSRPDVFRPDGRTDIPIFLIEIALRYGEHDPHAIIECKRIAGNDTRLCREYVVEGIDRFRTKKYAGNHSTGFMVGYLISGDAGNAAAGINCCLGRKRPSSRGAENLRPSELVDDSGAWRSNHPRTDSSPIEVHHAFLLFSIV